MTGDGWLDLLKIVGGPAVMAGAYRLWRDARTDRKQELAEARSAALEQARLEAVAREATAALEAKNAELQATKAEMADMKAELADYRASREQPQ